MTTRILTGNTNYRYYTTPKYIKTEGKTAIMLSAGITTRNIKNSNRTKTEKNTLGNHSKDNNENQKQLRQK